MHSRTSEYKVEVQVDHSCHYFSCITKNIPMGCLDCVLPEPLLRRHTQVNCILSDRDKQPYKDQICLFRALTIFFAWS